MRAQRRYIRSFDEISASDVGLVGGKTASLGEMYHALRPRGILIPNGFAITADAYRAVLDEANAWGRLREALAGLRIDDTNDLARRGHACREIVYGAGLPESLKREILRAYSDLQLEYGPQLSLAVRSSATAEDLPTASFAGQQDSFLNVRGEEKLLDACKRCFASLFTDRAIHYRVDNGFDHFKVALSIGIQKMGRSDLASSGVMFTIDTESGFRDIVLITGSYGLGENIVQGAVEPDEFVVFKPTFAQGHRAVLRRAMGSKKLKMVYAEGGTREATRNVPTPQVERERFCLGDADALALAGYAIDIERHYSDRSGQPVPMDIEWAKDGIDGKLYVVQARPETSASRKTGTVLEEYLIETDVTPLTSGRAVGNRIATGTARIIANSARIG